jgi:hypothetical protein
LSLRISADDCLKLVIVMLFCLAELIAGLTRVELLSPQVMKFRFCSSYFYANINTITTVELLHKLLADATVFIEILFGSIFSLAVSP